MAWPLHDNPGAFADLPGDVDVAGVRFAVLPIPYDATSTWGKGADKGPDAIIAASGHMELYDIETDSEPWRAGIATMAPVGGFDSPAAMVAGVRSAAAELIAAGRTVVGLGGEHSVTIGLVEAHADRYPGLNVLQIDAHGDTREEFHGSRLNHACVMARVAERCPYVAVGIRSIDAEEKARIKPERTFFAHNFTGVPEQIDAIVAQLDGPVYVTIDLDAIDPSEMPATGTPEPGGLTYRQVLNVLDAVCARHDVVGFDVVELCPTPESRASDFLAARLTYQMMAYLARK